jgi:hypothetical protein
MRDSSSIRRSLHLCSSSTVLAHGSAELLTLCRPRSRVRSLLCKGSLQTRRQTLAPRQVGQVTSKCRPSRVPSLATRHSVAATALQTRRNLKPQSDRELPAQFPVNQAEGGTVTRHRGRPCRSDAEPRRGQRHWGGIGGGRRPRAGHVEGPRGRAPPSRWSGPARAPPAARSWPRCCLLRPPAGGPRAQLLHSDLVFRVQ